MSKILVVCDQGNNRSVTIAHHIKYLGHDVLTAGLSTNSPETLTMLFNWADKVIATDEGQANDMSILGDKVLVWDVGPDRYPRPFNPHLLKLVRRLVDERRGEL